MKKSVNVKAVCRFLLSSVLPLAITVFVTAAETIVIESGSYEVLSRNNCISGDLQHAVVISKHPAWGIIPGTAWLQPDATKEHSTCAVYQAVFDLPEGYRSPRISVAVLVDDDASVFLNDQLLGKVAGFEGLARTVVTNNPRLFRAGRNTLLLQAGSGFGAFGIDFKATVEFTTGDPAEDSDMDGISDWWEVQSSMNASDPADASGDEDGDGLSNLREFQLRTDPRSADTDRDALADAKEDALGTDPNAADSDGDSFTDGDERSAGSNPLDARSKPRRETIVIRSGFSLMTARDCSQQTFRPVAKVGKGETWDLIPDTLWIQPSPTNQGHPCAVYRVTFELPEVFQTPAFRLESFVDGTMTAELNGKRLGSFGGFQHPPGTAATSDPASFLKGENELILRFQSDGGGDGIDFRAFLSYVPESDFRRGDVNHDGGINIVDPVAMLNFLFSTQSLSCHDAADVDNNGTLEISDPIGALGFLFLGTLPPAAPFDACGPDSGQDNLTCGSFSVCN